MTWVKSILCTTILIYLIKCYIYLHASSFYLKCLSGFVLTFRVIVRILKDISAISNVIKQELSKLLCSVLWNNHKRVSASKQASRLLPSRLSTNQICVSTWSRRVIGLGLLSIVLQGAGLVKTSVCDSDVILFFTFSLQHICRPTKNHAFNIFHVNKKQKNETKNKENVLKINETLMYCFTYLKHSNTQLTFNRIF